MIRDRRLKDREIGAIGVDVLVDTELSGFSGLIGTVFRYERRCWPLAMRGDILLRDEHGMIGVSESEARKAEGDRTGPHNMSCVSHS